MVDEQQRAVLLPAVALAAELVWPRRAERRVLDERERGHVPRRRPALLLSECQQTLSACDQRAERRRWLAAIERRDVARQPRVRDRLLDARRRHVVLDDHDQNLIGMPIEELSDDLEFSLQRLRSELAQGVAEVELGRAVQRPHADAPRDAVGDAQRQWRHLLGDLVAVGALGGQVGPHAPRSGVIHADVNVDQQCANAVVELARDAVALVGEVPAGLGAGGERVVRARKDDFVETALAEAGRAVATPRRRPGALFRGRGAEQEKHDEPGE